MSTKAKKRKKLLALKALLDKQAEVSSEIVVDCEPPSLTISEEVPVVLESLLSVVESEQVDSSESLSTPKRNSKRSSKK
jgi:hypothetical protein